MAAGLRRQKGAHMLRYAELNERGSRPQGTTERLALLALVELGPLTAPQLALRMGRSPMRTRAALDALVQDGTATSVGRRPIVYTATVRVAGSTCADCAGIRDVIGPLHQGADAHPRCPDCGGTADYVVLSQ